MHSPHATLASQKLRFGSLLQVLPGQVQKAYGVSVKTHGYKPGATTVPTE